MSRTESTFITESTYRKYRIKQDDDIQKAFAAQASLIENGNRQLHDGLTATFDNKLSTVNGTLSGRLGELNNELGRVKNDLRGLKDEVSQVKDEVSQVKDEVSQVKDEVSQVKDEVSQVKDEVSQVKDEVSQVKDEVSQVKDEVSQVKDEVSQVKEKMGEIEARLNHMEGRSFNRSRKMPSHTIAVIGVYRDPIGFRLPEYFPLTVKEFWKLQTSAFRGRLLYLLEFYEIQNFQHWAQTHRDLNSNYAIDIDDSSSNESDSEDNASQLSLAQAVDKFPEVALDELASCLGLPFGEIHSFFQRAAKHRQQQRLPAIKRYSTVPAPTNKVVKRPKHLESQLPLEELIAASASNSPSEQSTRISWDVSARNRAEAEMLAKMRAAPSVSTESSTDAISSQETRDLGHRKKPRSNKS